MASGFIAVVLISTGIFIFYKLGSPVLNMCESYSKNKKGSYTKKFIPTSRISFESPDDLKIFEPAETTIMLDEKFATDGKHSLLIEFPAGTNYPGIYFDVMGKNCLNWSSLETLSFDIQGDSNAATKITLKIKSGSEYPKRSFEREFDIPQGKTVKISINKDEMAKSLDLSKISYLKIFIDTPRDSYSLHLDNIELK